VVEEDAEKIQMGGRRREVGGNSASEIEIEFLSPPTPNT
jgi:hypothetical protein